MSEQNQKTNFAGVYFNRDAVLRLARLANLFAWVALVYYIFQALTAVTIFILQLARGLAAPAGFTDYAQQFVWMLQPILPGLLNFVGLQAIGHFLLMMMDVEDNLRRAARNKS